MKAVNKSLRLRGHTLDEECILYRVNVLKHALMANMSMGQLKRFSPALELKAESSTGLGDVKNLMGDVGRVLQDSIKDKVRDQLEDRYYPFVSVVDGSPAGANAEAIVIRFLRKSDLNIKQLLISLRLFKGSLTGEAIAHNVMTELRAYGLDLTDWMSCIMDRAASNQKALRVIKESRVSDVTNEPCHSHTVNLLGKELTKSCDLLREFRKAYNTGIMFRGKMSDEIHAMFDKKPVVSGGVRWYVEWEQVAELCLFKIEDVVVRLIPVLEEKKLSTASVKKMKEIAIPKCMPRLMVEAAAVADVGRFFCQSTYLLEGDDPLSLSAWTVFEKLDKYVKTGLDNVRFREETHKICTRAAELIEPIVYGIREQNLLSIELLTIEKEEFQQEQLEAQANLEAVIQQQGNGDALEGVGRRATRATRAPLRYRDNAEDDHEEEIPPSQAELQAVLNEKNESLEDTQRRIEDFEIDLRDTNETIKNDIGPETKIEFLEYAKEKVKPAFQKYQKLYKPGSRLHATKTAFIANKVFDIIYLKSNPPLMILNQFVKDLKHHDIPQFTDSFLKDMRDELPKLRDMVANDESFLNFDDTNDSIRYRKRLKTRAQRSRQRIAIQQAHDDFVRERGDAADAEWDTMNIRRVEDLNGNELEENDFRNVPDWKNDPGERSCRVYLWWQKLITSSRFSVLPNFELALTLVVLKQPSSAVVERVFSQLNNCRKVSGDSNGLQDVTYLCVKLRCNVDDDEEERCDDYI